MSHKSISSWLKNLPLLRSSHESKFKINETIELLERNKPSIEVRAVISLLQCTIHPDDLKDRLKEISCGWQLFKTEMLIAIDQAIQQVKPNIPRDSLSKHFVRDFIFQALTRRSDLMPASPQSIDRVLLACSEHLPRSLILAEEVKKVISSGQSLWLPSVEQFTKHDNLIGAGVQAFSVLMVLDEKRENHTYNKHLPLPHERKRLKEFLRNLKDEMRPLKDLLAVFEDFENLAQDETDPTLLRKALLKRSQRLKEKIQNSERIAA
jgi:hypothetical protein